ncbi:MAG: acetyl-CoA carboxylase, carboxyltransferase subunit beta [Proteobacteria bacterium]|nr:acetyl-CoA carboxylase, carboxyltransferase subunit beta [Pseudomonadota bacterium]
MAWLEREKAPVSSGERTETPDGLWIKCNSCHEVILRKELQQNLNVCNKCQYHFPIPVWDRIQSLVDDNSFEELDKNLKSSDPLNFTDSKPYKSRIEDAYKKNGRWDAFVSGRASILNIPVQLGVFDFQFMGGSMGSVVGEKISRLILRSLELKQPAIIVSTSGGARMQEGLVSLMQMAKTCAVLGKLRDHGVPYISVLCHPTTGGVAASFAMLGDINIGEPGALIGFAGPRVIQQTIRAQLPEGFQTAEYLLEHGMLDMICHRAELRQKIGNILGILTPSKSHS